MAISHHDQLSGLQGACQLVVGGAVSSSWSADTSPNAGSVTPRGMRTGVRTPTKSGSMGKLRSGGLEGVHRAKQQSGLILGGATSLVEDRLVRKVVSKLRAGQQAAAVLH